MKKVFILLLAAMTMLGTFGCASENGGQDVASGDNDVVSLPLGYSYTLGGSLYKAYDDQGRVTDQTFYDYKGEMISTTLFAYGDDGVTIKEYNALGELVAESFSTNKNGTELMISYLDGKKTEYAYSDSRLNEITRYDENGEVASIDTIKDGGAYSTRMHKDGKPVLETEYDAYGRQIKSISFNTMGQVFGYKLYSYDENGKNNRVDSYNSEGELTFSTAYSYNAAGAYHTVTTYDGNGVTTGLTEYGYDENGKQIMQIKYTYEDGNAVSYEKWVVDENGNSVLEGVYDAE